MTLMEIFYPIILMLICYLIKLAFDSTKVTWEDEEGLDQYLINKGNFGFDYSIYRYLIDFNQKLKEEPSVTDPIAYLPNYINDNVPADPHISHAVLREIRKRNPLSDRSTEARRSPERYSGAPDYRPFLLPSDGRSLLLSLSRSWNCRCAYCFLTCLVCSFPLTTYFVCLSVFSAGGSYTHERQPQARDMRLL